jgi:hypothetical protein
MTYESDSFARSLGLSLAGLPCLIFFDDPGGTHYYVMPMDQARDELMQENETLSADETQQLHKLYRRLGKHLAPETSFPSTGQGWLQALELALSGKLADRCDDAKKRLAKVQSALPAGNADIIAYFDRQLGTLRQRRQDEEQEQARLLYSLKTLDRPSLEPTIRSLRWADRRERTRQLTSAAIETVARDPSFLLKVLALFGIGG